MITIRITYIRIKNNQKQKQKKLKKKKKLSSTIASKTSCFNSPSTDRLDRFVSDASFFTSAINAMLL